MHFYGMFIDSSMYSVVYKINIWTKYPATYLIEIGTESSTVNTKKTSQTRIPSQVEYSLGGMYHKISDYWTKSDLEAHVPVG